MPREDDTVEVHLDATDPGALLEEPSPEGLWIRVVTSTGPGGGWPVIAVRGPRHAVRLFVDKHWDLGNLPDFEELVKEANAA
jgi:hypothetical protein